MASWRPGLQASSHEAWTWAGCKGSLMCWVRGGPVGGRARHFLETKGSKTVPQGNREQTACQCRNLSF